MRHSVQGMRRALASVTGRARRPLNFLPPVRRMRPNEVECRACGRAAEAVGVGGVEDVANVPRQARDAKFTAYVRACAADGHRVKDVLRTEEQKQIADEPAATVAGVTAVWP